jgi:hypothetical protein
MMTIEMRAGGSEVPQGPVMRAKRAKGGKYGCVFLCEMRWDGLLASRNAFCLGCVSLS